MGRYITAIVGLVRREPIRSWAVVRSIAIVVLAFWPGLVTPEQIGALAGLGATLFGVDEVIRQQVVPKVKE